MSKISCALIGEGLLLAQCAEILRSHGHSIEAIVTSNKVVADWAADRAIPVFDHSGNYADGLATLGYDWLFSIANLKIIPEAVWAKARQGAANFHDGPLPRYAGLNTPSWAIIEGETFHGVSWHALTSGIDEGGIYADQSFAIASDETAFTLNTKCFEAGLTTFTRTLENIEQGTLISRQQHLGDRNYFGRHDRPAAAATLRFDKPAEELSRLVRALDFGTGHPNTLVLPKVRAGTDVFTVTRFEVLEGEVSEAPGVVISVGAMGAVVATADRPALVEGTLVRGEETVFLSSTLRAGMTLPTLDDAASSALSDAVSRSVRHEGAFRRCLADPADVALPDVQAFDPSLSADIREFTSPLAEAPEMDRIALLTAFLVRLCNQRRFDVAYSNDEISQLCARHPGYFAKFVPLRIYSSVGESVDDFTRTMMQTAALTRNRLTYLSDLIERDPQLSSPKLTFGIMETAGAADAIEGCAITFVLGPKVSRILYDQNRVSEQRVRDLTARLEILANHFGAGSTSIDALPLMSEDERNQILYERNRTERPYQANTCVHQLIERQVELTPDADALAFQGRSLSYRQMDERANRIAHALIASGVGPDALVGLYLPRSLDLVVGALAIQKAGGAYVPLDPGFPSDRIAFMMRDSAAKMVLTERSLANSPSLEGTQTVCIEDVLEDFPSTRPVGGAGPDNLAYVIYTSGSTGNPKGVMVEHRNVVNFFAGMDDRVPRAHDRQNVWLAVTSLSFDISVLELFWTLARGFKVVIHASEVRERKAHASPACRRQRPMDFGLFYWGNDAGVGPDKYRLLLEGAKFADQHDFQAVWTPERHFHAFGGPYPNPSVTGAAVAAVTRNLSIRAGSCVLPLHHPVRVAEEWAVIDNISNGRVGLAFASGWMPEDFVLRPENVPPNNKTAMVRDIETVRALWRGEAVDFDFGAGATSVVTQPRPVQKELPVWLTTAGNPESYREAARLGANVLTHLLGQSISELAEKIRLYREALVEFGRNPAEYTVTLMLHTLVGEDREQVRSLARGPMKDYLRSAAALIKQYAWAFPAFKKPHGVSQPQDIDLQSLAADEMDAILDFAFDRYFDDSGLFGTVEDAQLRIDEVAAAGVDEIACLIDFGLPDDVVLERLTPLAKVVRNARAFDASQILIDNSFAVEVGRHGVTHLQCTPSMARMFMFSNEDRDALREIAHMFVGGEALHGSLLAELGSITDASVENMYGPTETTIWSSTFAAVPTPGVVPLGRPIANTQFYILDGSLDPVPPGMPGELYIGGHGVARGYLMREKLTRDRFLCNPFAEGRMYRTGDVVRFTEDWQLQFLGRADHQVKVRGYRIEIGEIEAQINAFADIHETVVVVREDQPDDRRIVAYIRTRGGAVPEDLLRAHLAKSLPEYMIPAHFVTLDAFPLTPNAKVDRKKLPKPEDIRKVAFEGFTEPADTFQSSIADTFKRALGLERIGVFESFFALGGHSLLAVQVHRELKASIAPELTITDIFRFPTVSSLADHIRDRGKAREYLSKVADRAAMRRSGRSERLADKSRVGGQA